MALKKSSLSKKTKAELITEYERLVDQMEEAKELSKEVHDVDNQALMNKADTLTKGANNKISKSVADLRKSVESSLNSLVEEILHEADTLQELKEAGDLLTKDLRLHNNIKVAADTLENLVTENEAKKHQFELESKQRQKDLEEKMSTQERDWKRQQEEKAYEADKKYKRKEEEFEEKMVQREQALKDKVQDFEEEKEELKELRKQIKEAPAALEKALTQQEKEIKQALKAQHDVEMKQAEQAWASEKQVLELKIVNLQDQLKKQQTEIKDLKQEAERANKRTQELAVKVIQGESRSNKEE